MKLHFELHQCPMGQRLDIEGYIVGKYPISYTVDECLEDFCHEWAWEFDTFVFVMYDSYIGGWILVDRSRNGVSYKQTLLTAAYRI